MKRAQRLPKRSIILFQSDSWYKKLPASKELVPLGIPDLKIVSIVFPSILKLFFQLLKLMSECLQLSLQFLKLPPRVGRLCFHISLGGRVMGDRTLAFCLEFCL